MTGNTAPKLQHIEVLRQMRADFSDCIGLKEEVDALDYALSAASTSGAFNASVYKTAEELAAYLESLYEVNGDGSFTGRKWDVAQRAAIAVMGVTPPWIDAKALEVAKQFTQDTETQRRASLQAEISEAMRQAALAPPSGEGVDEDKRDAIDGVLNRLEGWGKAYPIDMFGPITDEEHAWLHNTRPGLFDRISAGMGRHMAEKIAEDIATLRNIATPQSAPVDGVRSLLLRYGRHDADCATCHDSMDKPRPVCTCGFDAALTTPPPASQERGDSRICYVCGHRGDEHPIEPHPRGGTRRGKCPASPSSSAAEENVSEGSVAQSVEHVKEAPLTGRTPGRRVADGRGFESRQSPPIGAAEQAKPDGDDAAFNKRIGQYANDQQHAEQAQAGELHQSAEQLAQWLEAKYRRHGEDEDRQAAALLRRLAGGVTVDDVMVERAIIGAMAQARRDGVAMGDQRWDGSFPTRTMWRAALVAALGAK